MRLDVFKYVWNIFESILLLDEESSYVIGLSQEEPQQKKHFWGILGHFLWPLATHTDPTERKKKKLIRLEPQPPPPISEV